MQFVPKFSALARSRPGFLFLEALLAIVLLGLFIGAAGLTLMEGQQETVRSGDRTRALYLSEQALEAARSMRDDAFAGLTSGTHGIALSGGEWTLSGSQSSATGGFITRLTISALAGDRVWAEARTSWGRPIAGSGSITLATEIGNWRASKALRNWTAVTLTGSYTVAGALFNDIATAGNYAYVTSEVSGGGAGLYVITLSNPASPSLSTTVNLGAAGYQVATKGNMLYVLTADASAEIKAYDITNRSSPSLKTTYDLPGSAKGVSLRLVNPLLYVGAVPNTGAGEKAFYVFDVTATGSIVLKSSFDDTGTVSAIAVTGTSAYLADSEDTRELTVAKVSSTGASALLGGYNLTDGTWDGLSAAVTGTSALIGRQKNSFQELVVFAIQDGGIPTTPGPWYHEGSGSLVGVDADGTGCFGFLAASSGRKAMQVVNLIDKSTLTELTTYTSSTGKGRGLRYDHRRDIVYLLTDDSVVILQGSGSSGHPCP